MSIDLLRVQALIAEGKTAAAVSKILKLKSGEMKRLRKEDPKLDEIMKNAKRKIDIDYNYVNYLAKLDLPDYVIARKCGFSVETRWQGSSKCCQSEGFVDRKKRDPDLVHALESGRDDGDIALITTCMQKCRNQFMTICKDCGKKTMGNDFLPSCPYCDKEDPAEAPHANVKHKYIPADTTMLIWVTKNRLKWTDKQDLTVKNDGNSPFQINVTEDPQKRLSRYKKYFESQENEANSKPDELSGRNDNRQSLLQAETNAEANRIST
jgi:hypothetical protein